MTSAPSTGTYIPRKEVIVEETIRATIIKPNQAIKLRARKETLDRDGTPRVTGEEWLVKKVGAYLPGAYEEVVDVVDAYVLTEKVCAKNGDRARDEERGCNIGGSPPPLMVCELLFLWCYCRWPFTCEQPAPSRTRQG